MSQYRNLIWLLAGGWIMLCLTACTCTTINHPKPELTVDREPFMDDGCVADKNESYALCAETTLPGKLACQAVGFDDLLGGLDPHDPIATCIPSVPTPDHAWTFPYLIYRDGRYHLLSTPEEFRAWFAPIESKDEALSYALAMSGYKPRYGQPQCDSSIYIDYQVKRIEDTHVDQVDQWIAGYQYQVYLFWADTFNDYSLVVYVTTDGSIVIGDRQVIVKRP